MDNGTVNLFLGVALSLFLAFTVATHVALKGLINRLRSLDYNLWRNLGSPEPMLFARSGYVTSFRDGTLPAGYGPSSLFAFSVWLSQRGYYQLKDPDLSLSARRYRLLRRVQTAAIVIFFGIFLYSRRLSRGAIP